MKIINSENYKTKRDLWTDCLQKRKAEKGRVRPELKFELSEKVLAALEPRSLGIESLCVHIRSPLPHPLLRAVVALPVLGFFPGPRRASLP